MATKTPLLPEFLARVIEPRRPLPLKTAASDAKVSYKLLIFLYGAP